MDDTHSEYYFTTAMGTMKLAIEAGKILSIHLLDFNPELQHDGLLGENPEPEESLPDEDDRLAEAAIKQLHAYFSGEIKTFDLPLMLDDLSPFRRKITEVLMAVPFGETLSYQELATWAGNPKAARAVGTAVANNQWLIVVPCHRVLGSDGKLHGFSAPGGLDSKAWLLAHEKQMTSSKD